jgi:uncharacterized protein
MSLARMIGYDVGSRRVSAGRRSRWAPVRYRAGGCTGMFPEGVGGVMLRVENVTRGVTLVEAGRVADNAWTRFKGLIGVRELSAGDGMLIIPCSSVHCMWMSIPIDVVYCDRDDRVVGIDARLRPWRLGHLYRHAHHVIELPAGAAAAAATAIGDQLRVTR